MNKVNNKRSRYLRRVRRRLQLPGQLKDRVMNDFATSFQARAEEGKTDAEIILELGSPKDAAAVRNEQMKDYTFRKSPWRYLFAIVAIYGVIKLLKALASLITAFYLGVSMAVNDAASIGIIGGADGPTAIFVTTPRWTANIIPVAALMIGIIGFVLLSRCRRK